MTISSNQRENARRAAAGRGANTAAATAGRQIPASRRHGVRSAKAAALMMVASLASARGRVAATRPRRSTTTRSDRRSISSISEEISTIARPSATSCSMKAIDLLLGADVDAARRLVEDQDLGLDRKRPADQHFLLVAAAQRADLVPQARRDGCRACGSCRATKPRSLRRCRKGKRKKRARLDDGRRSPAPAGSAAARSALRSSVT